MLVEMLMAIALTAVMLPALLTGLFSAKQGKASQNQRAAAIALMKEGVEVVRNLREQSWTNVSNTGTYHPEILNQNWNLVFGDENLSGLDRSIIITDVMRDSAGNVVTSGGAYDPSTKRVEVKVSWGTPFPADVSTTIYLTRYNKNASSVQTTQQDFNSGTNQGTIVTNVGGGEVTLGAGGGGGNWCNPALSVTTVDLSRQGIPTSISATSSSNLNTIITGTGGNASGPTFVKTLITGNSPPQPTFKGQFNNSKANAVFTEDHYGFIATTNNSEEIQILDLNLYSNPPTNDTFTKIGTFNAPGNTQGNSIFATDKYGYMTAANNFYIFDLSSHSGARSQVNPTAVTLSGTGLKTIVNGNYAFVITNATTNQFQIIDVTNPVNPTLIASLPLGTMAGVDLAINQTGTRAYAITAHSATEQELYIINITNKTTPVKISGSYNTNGMLPKGISTATGNRLVIVGSGGTYQYQVVNISTETAPVMCGHYNIASGGYGVSSILQDDGYAYSYVATGDSNAELKIILGGAGGQFAYSGTFTSSPIDPGVSVNYNYFNPTFTQPPQTTIKFQIAIADPVNNSCTNASYTFLGPDGTASTYFTGAGAIPSLTSGNYKNPGRCLEYKAYLTTSDTASSPTLEGVSFNYSP